MREGPGALRVLAFDFGTGHIGVAAGQTLTGGAEAVGVLKARDGNPDWTAVATLLADWQPDRLLVGLPLNMDGSESPFCLRARKFARRLHGRFGLRVCMVDERLSTSEAKFLQGTPRQNYRKKPVDALAARLICETWLLNPDLCMSP